MRTVLIVVAMTLNVIGLAFTIASLQMSSICAREEEEKDNDCT